MFTHDEVRELIQKFLAKHGATIEHVSTAAPLSIRKPCKGYKTIFGDDTSIRADFEPRPREGLHFEFGETVWIQVEGARRGTLFLSDVDYGRFDYIRLEAKINRAGIDRRVTSEHRDRFDTVADEVVKYFLAAIEKVKVHDKDRIENKKIFNAFLSKLPIKPFLGASVSDTCAQASFQVKPFQVELSRDYSKPWYKVELSADELMSEQVIALFQFIEQMRIRGEQ